MLLCITCLALSCTVSISWLQGEVIVITATLLMKLVVLMMMMTMMMMMMMMMMKASLMSDRYIALSLLLNS